MEQVTKDAVMDPEKQKKVSLAYVLAAAAIWALIFYSVSSHHRPEQPKVALGSLQVCDSTR
jgi:hypothetical protein